LADEERLAGYYTLASASLLLADLPASTGKKLPRYPWRFPGTPAHTGKSTEPQCSSRQAAM